MGFSWKAFLYLLMGTWLSVRTIVHYYAETHNILLSMDYVKKQTTPTLKEIECTHTKVNKPTRKHKKFIDVQ